MELEEGELGSNRPMSTEFQFCKNEESWGWMVVTVAQQYEYLTVYLKMAKIVPHVMHILPQFLKSGKKQVQFSSFRNAIIVSGLRHYQLSSKMNMSCFVVETSPHAL